MTKNIFGATAAVSAIIASIIFVQEVSPADWTAGHLTAPIKIDGRLNDAGWKAAPEFSGFHLLSERAQGAPKAKTRFRVLSDARYVYVGVVCEEPMMDKLLARPVDRDGLVFAEDCVELFLDPVGSGIEYYQFALSANNDQWDKYWIEKGNTGLGDYSSTWESAVHKGKDFWSVEIRVPLSSLFHTRASAFSNKWKLNLTRERKPVSELSTWVLLTLGFHEPASWRTVAGMPRKAPADDLAITGVQPIIGSIDGKGQYEGKLIFTAVATKKSAGAYKLSAWAGKHLLAKDRELVIASGSGEMVLDNLAFPEQGRVLVRMELERSDGSSALGMASSVLISYKAITFELDEPFYAACIFADQDIRRIRGSVRANLPDNVLRKGKLTLTLTGPGISKPVIQRLRLKDSRALFDLDATSLRYGKAQLTARVIHAGQLAGEGVQVIRKLPPSQGSTVYIDRDLNLVVNGRPIFTRSWMGNATSMVSHAMQERYPAIKDAYPSTNYDNLAPWRIFTLEAHRLDPAAARDCVRDVMPSQKILDTIRERAEKGRDHPDMLHYYLSDEPECRNVSPVYLKHCYDLVKELDPYHPVVIVTRAPERYTECADILGMHPYINPTVDSSGNRMLMASMKNIPRQIRTALKASQGKILPWLTPQAFSYAMHSRHSDYPNFTEVRCMIWAAVANGCKGFFPFLYAQSLNRPGMFQGYRFSYESLAKLEPILLDPSSAPVTVEAPDDSVDVMVKRHGKQILVIAVNLLDRPVTATVHSPAFGALRSLDRFREPGKIRVKNGTLKLKFEPYGVYLLSSPSLDKGMKTVGQVRADVDRANAERNRKGNILFGRGREIEYSMSNPPYCMWSAMTLRQLLTDGMRDPLAWWHVKGSPPCWVEMAFLTFVPRFSVVKIFGNGMGKMELMIWKRGEWMHLGTAPADAGREVTFKFDKPVSTVKLRLVVPKSRAELYEIEMYK